MLACLSWDYGIMVMQAFTNDKFNVVTFVDLSITYVTPAYEML